jgi:hypothetical protein
MGIQGNRVSSPLWVIPEDAVIKGIRKSGGSRSFNLRWTIPTLKQFLKTLDERGFDMLSPDPKAKLKPEMNFIDLPNHIMTHPFVFEALDGMGEIPAKVAKAALVRDIRDVQEHDNPEDAVEMEEFIQGSHLPLAYIWAINRGLANPSPC